MKTSKDLEEKIRQTQPLIILGMHRSGTSLTVRLLKELGIHLGSYLSRDAEAVHFQKINRKIYRSVGSRWGDIDSLLQAMHSEAFIQAHTHTAIKTLFPDRHLLSLNPGISDFFGEDNWRALSTGDAVWWGWKDPRTTITFPIWLRVFPHAKFLYILRNGIDVAVSIHRRSIKQHKKIWKRMVPLDYCPKTLDFDYCFELWEKHVAYFYEHKTLIPYDQVLEIRYEDLLADPHQNLRAIAEFIDFPVQEKILDAACNQVDKSRLTNANYVKPYQDKIRNFIDSSWMLNLSYGYQLDSDN